MFKRLILLFTFLIGGLSLTAQNEATWSYSVEPANASVGDKGNLVFKVELKKGWHTYGVSSKCDKFGPSLTTLTLSKKEGFKLNGKFKAINPDVHFSEDFNCEISEVHGPTAYFKQDIIFTAEQVNFSGALNYQVCELYCLQPTDYNFSGSTQVAKAKKIILPPSTKGSVTGTKGDKTAPDVTPPKSNTKTANCDLCDKVDSLNTAIALLANPPASNEGTGVECNIDRKAGWDDITVTRYGDGDAKGMSLDEILLFILGAFLAGLVSVFTPCVFPMLPMTVTFFTKSNKTKGGAVSQALIYGFSIVAIYTIFGVVMGKLFGAQFAHFLSTNWAVNLVFFLIFVVFSLSFLGMFEITLPSGMVNKVDAKADKGGLLGTFFMALALVLVSFSCTGPIVGSLIVLSANGDWLVPTISMLAFAVAFALPFTITALFPSLLDKLPKSGGWLNSVKVVLGLAELALSLKFLSQVDQVLGLRILDREIFLVIWIAIALVIAIYLFGKIRFPHDSSIDKISVPRGILAIASLSFALYLIPGLWGAPLKSMAGLLPPLATQDFVLGQHVSPDDYACGKPIYGDDLHLAHDIKGYYDLRQAICCAQEQQKPLFVDFTGVTCANCRLMENKIWSDPRVLKMLREDFVVASLYVDYNKIKLPQSEWYKDKTGKEIKTLGNSLLDFEERFFKKTSMPYYTVLGVNSSENKNGNILLEELTHATGYTSDVEEYLQFLKEGLNNYKLVGVSKN